MAASAEPGLQPGPIPAVPGVRLAGVRAGIRNPDRLDLVAVELVEDSETCAVFTRNAFCAAPVEIARHHLRIASPRYLLINAGNANAGTGSAGREAALACCHALAQYRGVSPEQVLPFSTGVIGEALPVDSIGKALPQLLARLDAEAWPDAARGILTTDTKAKSAWTELAVNGECVRIAGFAKGAGMIRPDMATMLAFVFTDAELGRRQLDALLREQVAHSFNRITVDGDTSTNDACVLCATGAGPALEENDGTHWNRFRAALGEVFRHLAQAIVRDAEGAGKFITVRVSEGGNSGECLQVAYAGVAPGEDRLFRFGSELGADSGRSGPGRRGKPRHRPPAHPPRRRARGRPWRTAWGLLRRSRTCRHGGNRHRNRHPPRPRRLRGNRLDFGPEPRVRANQCGLPDLNPKTDRLNGK